MPRIISRLLPWMISVIERDGGLSITPGLPQMDRGVWNAVDSGGHEQFTLWQSPRRSAASQLAPSRMEIGLFMARHLRSRAKDRASSRRDVWAGAAR